MTELDEISQSVAEAEEALARGESDAALAALVDVREHGVTTKALEKAIAELRAGNESSFVGSWLEAVRQRLADGEENPFRGLAEDSKAFERVPSEAKLSAIEEELLGGLDDVLQEENGDAASFALVTNSEAESEGLTPGSMPDLDDSESDSEESSEPGPLTADQKTKLKSSLAERLRSKAKGFEEKLSTKKADSLSADLGSEEESEGEENSPEPREVVSNQGAVEDFFADLVDDDDQDEEIFELEEAVDPGSLVPEQTEDFEDPFEELDEESNVRDLTPMGSMDAVSRDVDGSESEVSTPDDDEEDSKLDPTNPFADLMYLEDDEPEEAEPEPSYDPGVSQVRYRGKEPAPPTHRLKSGDQVAKSDSDDFVLEPPEEDDVDFDLGFTNPESNAPANPFGDVNVSKPESEPAEDDFDFDLGLNEPKAERSGGDAIETKPGGEKPDPHVKETNPGIDNSRGDASETKPKGERQSPSREPQPTPLHLGDDRSEPIDEDEFFALAESFAVESSAAEQTPYRGEPVVKERSAREEHSTPMPEPEGDRDNPFAHEAPTGVRHAAVESSFVLEEVEEEKPARNSAASSQIATNMSGVLLEARRMYESGEFSEALSLCQKILSRGDNSEAEELVKTIEGEMERATIDQIGSLSRTPSLAIDMSDLSSMDLDHRAGFLISQIDGMMTFEDIIELSGMSRLETMEVLADLLRQSVIEVD